MRNQFINYQNGLPPTKKTYRAWPLYGAGLENLGMDHQMIEFPIPKLGPDELLIRHDACGLCFSDVKVINQGQNHPRIFRDMRKKPVILGHEVSITIVEVGENIRTDYKRGDRFIIQADIFFEGVNYAYGYEYQGGLSEYNIIDQRILQIGKGDYLIPVKSKTGYAESALVEPWACVIAAYLLDYRKSIKHGGTCLFVGPEPQRNFTISQGFKEGSHPEKIILCEMDGELSFWLRKKAAQFEIEVEEIKFETLFEKIQNESIDDIITFNTSASTLERLMPLLAYHGIIAISTEKELVGKIQLDVGRIHYNRWLIIGGDEMDLSQIYHRNPVKSLLKKSGRALFVGAGGPMGRMHVQHAIETAEKPSTIICTDLSDKRLDELSETFEETARENGIEWFCFNSDPNSAYFTNADQYRIGEFDDIVVLAPFSSVVSEVFHLLSRNGVMNIFAGISRGNYSEIDLNDLIFNNKRIIGHSASTVEDMKLMLNEVETGKLSTNRSVSAIGSLEAVPDGLEAVLSGKFPGKIVIFPNIGQLPLTSLKDLESILPSVYSKLEKGKIWSKEAEIELLEMLAFPHVEYDEGNDQG